MIEIGDVVAHLSGGPKMTVSHLNENGFYCRFFNEHKEAFQGMTFNSKELSEVKKSTKNILTFSEGEKVNMKSGGPSMIVSSVRDGLHPGIENQFVDCVWWAEGEFKKDTFRHQCLKQESV